MRDASYQPSHKATAIASIALAIIYSVGLVELGRELGHEESGEQYRRQLRVERKMIDCGGHPKKLYGHVHIAKTGGTSLNGIMANKFERVCGNKGYSHYAYHENELLAPKEDEGLEIVQHDYKEISSTEMDKIGYEDCDYVSTEDGAEWWTHSLKEKKFHDLDVELHVPCRDPIEHLMSQCNHHTPPRQLKCDAETDKEYFQSVEDCLIAHIDKRDNINRYTSELQKDFDVKCFDFKQSFTGYVDYMDRILETRRFEADHYVERSSNKRPRDKESECIWEKPDLIEKTRNFLVDDVEYYNFCNECMGSENELQLQMDGLAASTE